MSIPPLFALTPRLPQNVLSPEGTAILNVYGADFTHGGQTCFEEQCNNDSLYFSGIHAADPNIDYSQFSNRRKARYIKLYYDYSYLGANRDMALFFGCNASPLSITRWKIYSDAELLGDVNVEPYPTGGAIITVESLGPISLYFVNVHPQQPRPARGGFFFGIVGFIA